MKELELYIHIPFCVRKCEYCDFLSGPADDDVKKWYMDKLQGEIRYFGPDYSDYTVTSVFFGGGTPSILTARQITALMNELRSSFHIDPKAEITMECNPGTVTPEKARAMGWAGINRASIGLQSVHDEELKLLGRIHNYEDFLTCFGEIKKAGIHNVNVDLMSALPGQTVQSWEQTLKKVLLLHPDHISAYSLIIEENTPFHDKYHKDDFVRRQGGEPRFLPSEEAEREMYVMTKEILAQKGFHRYEISNYAKEGRECQHNIGYWTGKNYLGLGLGASSMVEGTRFNNTSVLKDYLLGSYQHEGMQTLTRKEQMEEFMFLGLRMMAGVTRDGFLDRFGIPIESIYGQKLLKLQQEGLLVLKERQIYLSEKGIDLSNLVLAEFLLS